MNKHAVIVLAVLSPAALGDEPGVTPRGYSVTASHTVTVEGSPPSTANEKVGQRRQDDSETQTDTRPGGAYANPTYHDDNLDDNPYQAGSDPSASVRYFYDPDTDSYPGNQIVLRAHTYQYAVSQAGVFIDVRSHGSGVATAAFMADQYVRMRVSYEARLDLYGTNTDKKHASALLEGQARVQLPGEDYPYRSTFVRTTDLGNELIFGESGFLVEPGTLITLVAQARSYGTTQRESDDVRLTTDITLTVDLEPLDVPGCNIADRELPYGEFDFQDVLSFLVAFGDNDTSVDFAPPFDVVDYQDFREWATALLIGCP